MYMAHGIGFGPGGSGGPFLTEEERNSRPKVTRELIGRILSYIRPYWKQMLIALVCVAASSVMNLLPAILTGKIIDDGLIGKNMNLLIRLMVLALAVILTANLIGVVQSWMNAWIAQHVTYDLRNSMFRHLEEMPQKFFTSSSQGDIITHMTSDIDGVESLMSNTFTNILSNAITLVAAITAMFHKNSVMAVVGLLIIPLFVLPTRKAGKSRWNMTREAQACNDRINGILGETMSVSGQLLVKLFGREQYEYDRYEAENKKMIGLRIRERMAGRWFFMAISTFASIGPMLIYLTGGILLIYRGADLTVGDITVLAALLAKMYGPVNSLLNLQVEWIRSMALFTRIFSCLDMPLDIKNDPDAVIPEHAEGAVCFRQVGFSYDGKEPVLQDISFDLEQGKSIAIVGPSGAGKSTIVNLIPRLYDVTSGNVCFDGIDVRKIDLGWLRANIGIVTQDTYLFNSSIRENLLYAKPDAAEEELILACKKANIYSMIEKLPDGLDTLVGNRGLELSGGERQRISIARVLLKDPALLIFDEATSALDSISETAIQSAIEPLIRTRTSILIAHRLSTILAADQILVTENGRIVERGTHAELLNLGGVYMKLYQTQFGGREAA